MPGNVPAAPQFSRRVHDAGELMLALAEAVRATGLAANDIAFSGVVRLETEDAGEGSPDATKFTLTILKRN